jgi:hypothetical protein
MPATVAFRQQAGKAPETRHFAANHQLLREHVLLYA